MSLWQVGLACIFTWISGAAFFIAVRDGLFEPEGSAGSPFANRSYDNVAWPWLNSPVMLVEVGLFAAFVVGSLALIVVSRT